MGIFPNRRSGEVTSDSQIEAPDKMEERWQARLRVCTLCVIFAVFAIIAPAIAVYFVHELFTDVEFAKTVMDRLIDAIPTIISVVIVMFGFKGAFRGKN